MKRPELLWAAQLGLCYLCGGEMSHLAFTARGAPQGWTRDHLIARSHGGSLSTANVLLAHAGCNSKRGNAAPTRAMVEYAKHVAKIARALRALVDQIPTVGDTRVLRDSMLAVDVLLALKGVIGPTEWPTLRFEQARTALRVNYLRGMK